MISIIAVTIIVVGFGGIIYLKGQASARSAGITADISNTTPASIPAFPPASPTAPIYSGTSTDRTAADTATEKSSTTLATSSPAKTATTPAATQKSQSVATTTTVVSATPAPTTTPAAAPVAAPTPVETVPTPVTTNASAPATTEQTLPYSIGTFKNSFEDGDGWIDSWGNITQDGTVLTISANATSTGGGALLLGSDGWSNYTFQTNVDWLKGQSFGLVARFVDPSDYVMCDFDEPSVGSVSVSIREYVNGTATNLASGWVTNYNEMGGSNIPVALAVQGNEATCAFDGNQISTVVASAVIDPSLKAGGIGFTMWDPNMNNSEIVVHSVGVVSQAYSLGTYVSQD